MNSRVPPLNAVRVFEAASRHLNFARTAEELGVTQSAVSKQIALLESYVGSKLFERESNGVSLTHEGRELKQTVGPAFDLLTSSFERYSRRSQYSKTIRVTTVISLASQFLVPHLPEFKTRFPETDVELLTSDRLLDLRQETVDVSIRYGNGDWPDVVSTPLGSQTLVPVCSTDSYSDRNGDKANILEEFPRIQTTLLDEWGAFDRTMTKKKSPENNVIMEHFVVALEATRTGQGISLLPEILVRRDLEQGSLIALSEPMEWSYGFYLSYLPGTESQARTKDFISWILSKSNNLRT